MRAMAIADMDVMTDIRRAAGCRSLVADLAAGPSCETPPAPAGFHRPGALDKVTAALAQISPGQGRACLIETLARSHAAAHFANDSQPITRQPGSR